MKVLEGISSTGNPKEGNGHCKKGCVVPTEFLSENDTNKNELEAKLAKLFLCLEKEDDEIESLQKKLNAFLSLSSGKNPCEEKMVKSAKCPNKKTPTTLSDVATHHSEHCSSLGYYALISSHADKHDHDQQKLITISKNVVVDSPSVPDDTRIPGICPQMDQLVKDVNSIIHVKQQLKEENLKLFTEFQKQQQKSEEILRLKNIECSNMKEQIQVLEDQVKNDLTNNDNAPKELSKKEKDIRCQLQVEFDQTLQKEKNTLQKDKDALQKEKNTLQKEKDVLYKVKDALHKEKDNLKNEKNTLQKEKDTLQKEKELLHSSLTTQHELALAKQEKDLRTQLEQQFDLTLKEERQLRTQLQTEHEQNLIKEKEIGSQMHQKYVESMNKEQELQIRLEEHVSNALKEEKQRQLFESLVSTLKEENKQCNVELDQLKSDSSNYKEKITELLSEVKSKESELSIGKDKISQLESIKAECEEREILLKSNAVDIEKKLNEYMKSSQILEKEKGDLCLEMSSVKKQLDTLKQKQNDHEQELSKCKSEIVMAEEAKMKAEQIASRCKKQVVTMTARVNAADQSIALKVKEIAKLEKSLISTQVGAKDMDSNMETLKNELESLQKTEAKSLKSLTDARKENGRLQTSLATSRQELSVCKQLIEDQKKRSVTFSCAVIALLALILAILGLK